MKVMNKGLQMYMIEKDLDKAGVDPQTVDIKARVDPALTYPENKENFQKNIVNEATLHSELNPENENLHTTTHLPPTKLNIETGKWEEIKNNN